MEERGPRGDGSSRRPNPGSRAWWALVAIIAAVYLIGFFALQGRSQPNQVQLTYSAFQSQVAAGNVVSVTSSDGSLSGRTKRPVAASGNPNQTSTSFTTQVPGFAGQGLETLLQRHHVSVDAKPPAPRTPASPSSSPSGPWSC